jgi:hypothetical protein
MGPAPPRHTTLPFPPRPFVPGTSPHPRHDPSATVFDWRPAPWRPDEWAALPPYLYGVDLYNHGYWWEAHEAWEALWHAAGRRGEAAEFVQGLIHAAAAALNRARGREAGAARQARKALLRLRPVAAGHERYMGLRVDAFAGAIDRSFVSGSDPPPRLELEGSRLVRP